MSVMEIVGTSQEMRMRKMTKKELITRLVDLTNTVEDTDQESFDDGEVEDLVVEAGIPITRSGSGRTLNAEERFLRG